MSNPSQQGRRIAAALLLSTLLASGPVQANDLREALVEAYLSNPTLQAARAQQRATDEEVPIQAAAGAPNITATANHLEFVKRSPNSFTAPERRFQIGPDLWRRCPNWQSEWT